MSIETASLKGRYMQEVYDIVCKYPKGVTASDIRRLRPEIPSKSIGAVFKKLKDLGLVRSEYIGTSNAHIWYRK